MTFEVDNTTQLLLKELQKNMEGTVSSVRDSHEEVALSLQSIKETLSETASAAGLADMKKEILQAEEQNKKGLEEAVEKVQAGLGMLEEKIASAPGREMFTELEEQITKYHQFVSDFKSQFIKVNSDVLRKQAASSEELLSVLAAVSEAIKQEENKLVEQMWALSGNEDEIKTLIGKCAVRNDIADAVQSLQKNIYAFTNKLLANYTSRVLTKLEEVSEKLEGYNSALTSFEDEIRESTGKMETQIVEINETENKNSLILQKVSDYLSLPGYKRFFKGMDHI